MTRPIGNSILLVIDHRVPIAVSNSVTAHLTQEFEAVTDFVIPIVHIGLVHPELLYIRVLIPQILNHLHRCLSIVRIKPSRRLVDVIPEVEIVHLLAVGSGRGVADGKVTFREVLKDALHRDARRATERESCRSVRHSVIGERGYGRLGGHNCDGRGDSILLF